MKNTYIHLLKNRATKLFCLGLFALLFCRLDCKSQDLINPYSNKTGLSVINDLKYNTDLGSAYYESKMGQDKRSYWGEFQLLLDDFPWGETGLTGIKRKFIQEIIDDNSNYALSYYVETVSFPFSLECHFSQSGNCQDGTSTRVLTLPNPNNAIFNNIGAKWWEYTDYGHAYKLFTKTPKRDFNVYSLSNTYSDLVGVISKESSLASNGFVKDAGGDNVNDVFPHTVLKFTISIHCGNSSTAPILNSFSFLIDLTRGKMREYPFIATNSETTDLAVYDLLVRPQLLSSFNDFSRSTNCSEYCIFTNDLNDICETQPGYKGGTTNLTPFNISDDAACALLMGIYSDYNVNNSGDNYFSGAFIQRLPIPPFSILTSTFVRDFEGLNYAGYYEDASVLLPYVQNSMAIHTYEINENILLEEINSIDRIIYNPSEANVTASNLHFPSNYTFKTIRGTYPYYTDVLNSNTADNGGPYSNYNDVPVETDLELEHHVTGYPSGDSKYSSIYHLQSGSKLTIEPCVKLFDCIFEINPGSEMVFANETGGPTINPDRYQLLYNGGTVTKRALTFTLPEPTGSYTETRSILRYESAEPLVAAGQFGDYTVASGADVTFASELQVVLKDGFRANQGSKFHAYITPVNLPGCNGSRIGRDNSEGNFSDTFSKNGDFFLAPSVTSNSSNMHFKVQKDGYYTIEVMNSLGEIKKTVYNNRYFKSEDYSVSQDFTDLAPGVYLCTLTGNNQQVSTKFIKSN